MDDKTAAEILGDSIDQAIAAELGQPDPRIANTPSAPTTDDGEQPSQPAPWNDDEVTS